MNGSVHVLVNNAGILEKGGRRETIDGYEAHFGTNYLGHVLLTYLLLNLRKGKKGCQQTRVINVSSCQHRVGSWLDFEDLNMKNSYSMEQAYGNSKAAMVMFSQILETKFSVPSVSLHPGVVYTDMATSESSWVSLISRYLMKSSNEGASSLVYAALDPILYKVSRAGKYLKNNQLVNISSFTAARSNQKKLWDKTCCMLKPHFQKR
ncbi:dehydrogenase/reductase SDR family member on chromosome X isoform X2 [Eurytemora carolleeae]|uniref:dehydrogenase/reductase SDR family member on chromosome X isoform X2 n=1 Tax=Eurytemora carolleeae TaxID=1294199 RepID=UPI000C789940|nr:dehydrogenase/reductase SDR family member on chromosome X isoform X2 [Eurytemora carolleeae]|eukprot:XP_023320571.1 dehydrogenase/reductase SDR family member on chromosome X-like isoform X2 [Eurytemora affinis]